MNADTVYKDIRDCLQPSQLRLVQDRQSNFPEDFLLFSEHIPTLSHPSITVYFIKDIPLVQSLLRVSGGEGERGDGRGQLRGLKAPLARA